LKTIFANRRKTILKGTTRSVDRLASRHSLAAVDRTKLEDLPLNHAAIMTAPVFGHPPCAMAVAVLAANLRAQKRPRTRRRPGKELGRNNRRLRQPRPSKTKGLARSNAPEFATIAGRSGRRGLSIGHGRASLRSRGATTHDSLGAAPKDDSFLAFEAALGHIEGVGGQEVVPAAGLTWRDACC